MIDSSFKNKTFTSVSCSPASWICHHAFCTCSIVGKWAPYLSPKPPQLLDSSTPCTFPPRITFQWENVMFPFATLGHFTLNHGYGRKDTFQYLKELGLFNVNALFITPTGSTRSRGLGVPTQILQFGVNTVILLRFWGTLSAALHC